MKATWLFTSMIRPEAGKIDGTRPPFAVGLPADWLGFDGDACEISFKTAPFGRTTVAGGDEGARMASIPCFYCCRGCGMCARQIELLE